jgi:hypothetical protein
MEHFQQYKNWKAKNSFPWSLHREEVAVVVPAQMQTMEAVEEELGQIPTSEPLPGAPEVREEMEVSQMQYEESDLRVVEVVVLLKMVKMESLEREGGMVDRDWSLLTEHLEEVFPQIMPVEVVAMEVEKVVMAEAMRELELARLRVDRQTREEEGVVPEQTPQEAAVLASSS